MATPTKAAAEKSTASTRSKRSDEHESDESLATTTAAALLEIDRLGRLSDKTRSTLAERLGERAKGLVIDVDDDEHQADNDDKES